MKHYFTLTAQDALVLSQNNATTGAHQTLDYIPGSAVLGALAGIDYPNDEELAWSLFHSGEVVFSNCYPIIDGQPGLPTPFSWHYKKGDANTEHIDAWINQSSANFIREENIQYEQLRGKYVFANGRRARPNIAFCTKTAIDSESGTAKQGQLFNYQHICEGQHFVGWVECPDELDDQISRRLSGMLRIGRSKGSEFGRTIIKPITLANSWPPQNSQVLGNTLTLWCISDIELIDQYGCPTLSPSAADLHPLLASSKLIPEQTFIRYHSVNRFNGHRQCFDSESRLITKGSIITLNLDPDVSESELRSELSNGIGINRHLGYGLVVINPIWAQQPKPKQPIFDADSIETQTEKLVHTQATPLTQWVTSQLNHSTTRRTAQREAIILAEEIVQGYHHARKYNNVPDAYQIGPSRSQWRRINDLLRSELSQQWASKTFEGEHRIAKATNDPQGWGAQWIQEECSTTFADYCNIHMSGRSEASLLKAIEILTRANPAESEGLKRITLSLRDEKAMTNDEHSKQEALS